MPLPSTLKIIIEKEQSGCIQDNENMRSVDHLNSSNVLHINSSSSSESTTKCVENIKSSSSQPSDEISLLFSRLGLKNKQAVASPSSIIVEQQPTPFQQQPIIISTDHHSNHLQVNSFPLLLAPSNKNRKSRMVFFASPSEECESTVREILSTLSSRFHSAIESKSASITKQKKMKASSSSPNRFYKSSYDHSC